MLQIADYRIPGHIRFIEEFPRTPMGKILRPQLRRALLEELAALAGNGTV
jgi:acyl-coenzyme A synthetase/AMP-(fatty) acid ligase